MKIDTTPPAFKWRGVIPGGDRARAARDVQLRRPRPQPDGRDRLARHRPVRDFAARKKGLERETGSRSIEVVPRYKNGKAFMPGLYRVGLTLTDEAGQHDDDQQKAFRDYRPRRPRSGGG